MVGPLLDLSTTKSVSTNVPEFPDSSSAPERVDARGEYVCEDPTTLKNAKGTSRHLVFQR